MIDLESLCLLLKFLDVGVVKVLFYLLFYYKSHPNRAFVSILSNKLSQSVNLAS